MRPIEWYSEHADELAQEVVDAWTDRATSDNAAPVSDNAAPVSDNAAPVSDDFQALFEMASQYRIAKATADSRRQFPDLKSIDEVEQKAAREAFAEAYKSYSERNARGGPA